MSNLSTKVVCVVSLVMGTAGFVVADDGKEPTVGSIPREAVRDGDLDVELAPDYIVAYARSGEVAGYVRKADLFPVTGMPSLRMEVVDDSLSRVIGHMVTDRGFVPLGTSDEEVPEFEEVPPEIMKEMVDRIRTTP